MKYLASPREFKPMRNTVNRPRNPDNMQIDNNIKKTTPANKTSDNS